MKKLISTIFTILAMATLISATTINNDLQLVGGGGEVVAYYISSDADFTSEVYFVTPSEQLLMFTNHPGPGFGHMVDLGYFPAGTDLFFGLFVQNTGYSFLSGDANNNPDNFKHAQVTNYAANGNIPAGRLVCFEDQYGGGDHDCGTPGADVAFVVAVAGVPEPSCGFLVLAGTVLILGSKHRPRRRV